MAAKAGPAHDWPNSGPLPASWKRSDQAGRVFFVHRRARARAGCGVNRVPTATFGPVTAAAPAFARADASLQPALLLSAGGALPPWHRGPAIFLRSGYRTACCCPLRSAVYTIQTVRRGLRHGPELLSQPVLFSPADGSRQL